MFAKSEITWDNRKWGRGESKNKINIKEEIKGEKTFRDWREEIERRYS